MNDATTPSDSNNNTNVTGSNNNSIVGLGNGARRYDEMYNITLTFVGFLVVFACCVVLLLALLRAEQRLAATAEGKLPVDPARAQLIQQALIVWEWSGHKPGTRTIKIGSDGDGNREDSSSSPPAADGETNDESSSSSSTTIMDIILSASERAIVPPEEGPLARTIMRSLHSSFSEGEGCPICLTRFEEHQQVCRSNNTQQCKHVYHRDCLVPWLRRHNECPMCRATYLLPVTSTT